MGGACGAKASCGLTAETDIMDNSLEMTVWFRVTKVFTVFTPLQSIVVGDAGELVAARAWGLFGLVMSCYKCRRSNMKLIWPPHLGNQECTCAVDLLVVYHKLKG